MKNKKIKTQTTVSQVDQLDSDSVVESDSQLMASEEVEFDDQQSNGTDLESMDSDDPNSQLPLNDNNCPDIESIIEIKENGAKVDKNKRKGLTVKELNNFRETEDLFNSNLFRLQLDQMLSEVKLKDKYRNRIDEWLKSFKSVLLSIKSGKCYQLSDQLWCKKVKIPIIQEPFEVKASFTFKTPKTCKIIGGYDLGTATGRQTIIDIAVEMPKDCWQRHDNLNHRYHRKRALFLSHICSAIKSNQLVSNIKFCYLNGNHMKPIALIEPNGSLSKHMRVALTLYPEHDNKSLRNNRFTPEKNNIRSDWTQMSDTEEFESPTPTYNSCIQSDLNLISNYQYLAETIGQSSSLKDGLILLKLWLKQRKLKNEFYFVISLFVCHLISKHKINHSFSCYQIFRTTLLSIVNSKWDIEGQAISDETYLPLTDYLSYFPVVLIDKSGYHNICWDVTIDSYDRLRHESKLTIDYLDSNHKNGFELTFLTPISFEFKFDVLLNISVESLLNSSKVSDITTDIVDNCGDTITAFVGHLIPLIKRTVGKRCLLVQHLSKSYDNIEWSSDQLPPHPNDRKWLTFGLLIDSQNAYNNIERGPPADSPEAKQFKDFWGQKSELRRFQDNAICEAVYWKSKTFADKRKIISKSLDFILTNILDIPSESLSTTASFLDPILERSHLKFADKTVYGTGEELTFRITREFDDLAKKLRSLEDLPLSITTVQPIDSVLRSTDVFPPLAMNSGKADKSLNNCNIFDVLVSEQKALKYFKPIEVVIQLEGSGKWPNHLDAFLRVKASFYLEMSQKLTQMFGIISYATPEYVDIFQNGWIFRLIIGTHKQLVLMRQITTSDGLSKHIENPEADRLEAKTEILPKITSALSALGRTHLCYGLTSRLAKRWIASQMLSLYFDDMAIDLMIAYIFTNPGPYTVPNSPVVAFLRFLSLICDHNWKTSPLIVNFENENNQQIYQQISDVFTKNRSEYTVMFITTTFDKILSQWTRLWPDSVVLKRLQVLATAAKQTLILQMRNPSEINTKVLFGPDLDIYDVVINLKSDQITNQIQAIDVKENNYLLIKEFDPKLNHRMPINDFDPIRQYLQQLIKNYSEFGLFFYDQFGGQHIGVIWKPSVFETKPFNNRELNGVRLSSTSNESGLQNIGTNIEALIEDFSILGEGIMDSLDIKTDNWIK